MRDLSFVVFYQVKCLSWNPIEYNYSRRIMKIISYYFQSKSEEYLTVNDPNDEKNSSSYVSK